MKRDRWKKLGNIWTKEVSTLIEQIHFSISIYYDPIINEFKLCFYLKYQYNFSVDVLKILSTQVC